MNILNRKLSLDPLLAIIVFHACIVRLMYVPGYNAIATFLCAFLLLTMLPKLRILFGGTYARVNLILLAMSFAMVLSSVFNGYNLDGTLLFIARINLLTWYLELQARKGKLREVATVFFLCSAVYLLATWWFILSDPLRAWHSDSYYLVGSKFSVSYLCLFGLVMYVISIGRGKHKTFSFLVLAGMCILSILLIIRVDCTTGVFGIALLIALVALRNALGSSLRSPAFYVGTSLVATFVLVLFSEAITHIGFVADFITDFLGKSITLTGRSYVYEHVLPFLAQSPLLGNGYNSVYVLFDGQMTFSATGYALNAQNAILEYCLYFGIVGVFLLYWFVCHILSVARSQSSGGEPWRGYIVLAGLYVLTLLGMVEITINVQFFAYLAFYYALSVGCADVSAGEGRAVAEVRGRGIPATERSMRLGLYE